MKRLVPKMYEHDPDMARKLELIIERIAQGAANLDCIGTDDPTAPQIGDPTDRVTEYFFRRWPEYAHDLGKALARADQVLGRRQFLSVISSAVS